MIKDLIKILDERRHKLTGILRNKTETVDVGKQHQIYGAIHELDLIIRVLKFHHEKTLAENDPIKRMSNETEAEIVDAFKNEMHQLQDETYVSEEVNQDVETVAKST